MSDKINVREISAQALNTKEVRQALEQKGLKLQKESLFRVTDDGTVKVDIDGDGIYDKNVTGLVTKSGKINTKADNIKVADENVSTKTIDDMNANVEKLKAKVEEKANALKTSFNETQVKSNAEVSFLKEYAKYQKAAADAEQAVKNKEKEYSAEMTTKELKTYSKELKELKKAAQEAKEKLEDFSKTKEDYIKKAIKSAKSKFEKTQEENEAQLEKAKTNLAKYQAAYNDFLDMNGYTTKESRKNVKTKTIPAVGNALAEAKDKNAVIEETVRSFVKDNPNLSALGDNYKIEINGGTVTIKADDGDDRADYIITGLYNEKTGELSTDKATIRLTSAQSSTAAVRVYVSKFKADLEKLNAMNADINIDKNNKEYKALEESINQTKAKLKAMNVTPEELE